MKQLIVILLFSFISCQSPQKNNIISTPPLMTSDTLSHVTIDTEEIFGSAMCMFICDSIIYIEDHFHRDTSVWGFHIGKKKITTAYARKGRGPGEVMSPSSNINYNPQKSYFNLYDPNYKKLIEYDLKNKSFTEHRFPVRDSVFKLNFIQDIIKKDSLYICMGTGGGFSKEKRFIILTENFQFFKALDGYPQINPITPSDIAEIYQFGEEIHMKPDGSKFVFGSYIGGILEIFDLQHIPDSIPIIQRHFYYRPIYNKNKTGNISSVNETIYGFENIYVTNNAIYTLLFEYDKPEITFPNKIIVYDWNGNWIKSYSLDCMVHGICVDEIQQKIYAMAYSEEESFHLVYFNL